MKDRIEQALKKAISDWESCTSLIGRLQSDAFDTSQSIKQVQDKLAELQAKKRTIEMEIQNVNMKRSEKEGQINALESISEQ